MCFPTDFLNGSSFWVLLRFKLLKWWAQSFLPGVPRIIAGFRDPDGVVVAVETFPVSEISHIIKVALLLLYNCYYLILLEPY